MIVPKREAAEWPLIGSWLTSSGTQRAKCLHLSSVPSSACATEPWATRAAPLWSIRAVPPPSGKPGERGAYGYTLDSPPLNPANPAWCQWHQHITAEPSPAVLKASPGTGEWGTSVFTLSVSLQIYKNGLRERYMADRYSVSSVECSHHVMD